MEDVDVLLALIGVSATGAVVAGTAFSTLAAAFFGALSAVLTVYAIYGLDVGGNFTLSKKAIQ